MTTTTNQPSKTNRPSFTAAKRRAASLPSLQMVRGSGRAIVSFAGKRLLSLLTWEIVWLAPDPTTEPRTYTSSVTGEHRIVFDPRYGLPLKCVCCGAPAVRGLPRCFECHAVNLRKIGAKWLPAMLAVLLIMGSFAWCVLHAKGLVKW